MNSPITEYLEDAQGMVHHLGTAASRLEEAIPAARITRQRAKDACDALTAAEAEIAAELAMRAMAKEGPLAGLAASSKAYQYAMDDQLAKARAGTLRDLAWSASKAQAQAEAAAIELEQAQARFSATRHAADLLGAMLHATRI